MTTAKEEMDLKQELVSANKVKFILPKKIFDSGMFLYTVNAEKVDSPLAEAILKVRGVEKVLLAPNSITITISTFADTEMAAEDAKKVILQNLGRMEKPEHYSYEKAVVMDKQEETKRVQELLDQEINPQVGMHGGAVELVGIKGSTAYLKFGGGCHGCGMVDVTLKQGIEVRIKEVVPQIKEVVDVTDHASGHDPYM